MRAVISGWRKGSGHSRRVGAGAGLRLRVRMRALISGRGGGGGGRNTSGQWSLSPGFLVELESNYSTPLSQKYRLTYRR